MNHVADLLEDILRGSKAVSIKGWPPKAWMKGEIFPAKTVKEVVVD